MNNGITIIARNVQPTGNKFYIEDYQIVNRCQTSHVLFNQKETVDNSVMVPVRLIGTQDEDVINAIIRATNRQTEVKEDQFFALQEFPKELELFFRTFSDPQKLYYERRSRQYDRQDIEKTRIVTPPNMIRAFAAMFLDEPHRTTRNYASLASKVGKEIFVKGHRMEPYYTAAFTLYKLEYFFRSGRLEPKYKPARFHILLAARILGNPERLPRMNSRDMERYCKVLTDILWEASKADDLITRAAMVVEQAASGDFRRDNIRTEPFTQRVIAYCQGSTATEAAASP
ncbi:MAG: AIPR family protein [Terriglobia bacterium]